DTVATGSIDTSFYRDDFSSRGLKVKNKPSKIDTEINDKHIILIDERYTSIEANHEIKDKKIDIKKRSF
ncbi:MAG: Bifunctional protein PyrR : Pyrimidine operon regulatory protein, partial [Bacteroidota bacterium]